MKKDPSLRPVPVPPSHRWREFRIQLMPFVAFVVATCSVVYIWREHISPPTFAGEVLGNSGIVTSTQPGTITTVEAGLFQHVKKGQPILKVSITSPERRAALEDLANARVEALRALREPARADVELQLEIGRLQSSIIDYEVKLETAKAELKNIKKAYEREKELWLSGQSSQAVFEAAESQHDMLVETIKTFEERIPKIKAILANAEKINVIDSDVALNRGIEALRKDTLALDPGEETILSPIDGIVSFIHRGAGANIAAGETLVTISPLKADRILGYLRQPITLEPEKGMTVEVRSRSALTKRQVALATIEYVGMHFENISTNLLTKTATGVVPEMGRPVMVSLPPNFAAFPGEIVDVTLKPRKK